MELRRPSATGRQTDHAQQLGVAIRSKAAYPVTCAMVEPQANRLPVILIS